MDSKDLRVGVIGAGVVGFTVASILQNELRNSKITIIAENFTNGTTSSVAAGIFRPGTSFRGPTPEITKRWVDDSWHYWHDLLKTSEAPNAGVYATSGYIYSKSNPHITKNHLIEDLLPIYRSTTENELKLVGGQGWKYGAFFSTLAVSCDNYLPWSENNFLKKGGEILRKKIDSFAAVKGQFDLVFNCTGLGSKYLCNDHDLVPIRGQVIKLKAPWLKTAFYGDYDTYIIPGINGIATLGGTRQYDIYNLSPCRHDQAAILERCYELLPALKKAEIITTKVGLRPHRSPVRVDVEYGPGNMKLVHCYGHGGYGVTCAPGTALHAVRLGLDFLKTNAKHKL